MKRSITRTYWVETPNKWLADSSGTIWEYGQYKNCYLCVRKDKNGKYIPSVNGCINIRTENWDFSNNEPMRFETLEQAQKHCMDYMDQRRAEEKAAYASNEKALHVYLKAYSQSQNEE
jgi:hypothetical protein